MVIGDACLLISLPNTLLRVKYLITFEDVRSPISFLTHVQLRKVVKEHMHTSCIASPLRLLLLCFAFVLCCEALVKVEIGEEEREGGPRCKVGVTNTWPCLVSSGQLT